MHQVAAFYKLLDKLDARLTLAYLPLVAAFQAPLAARLSALANRSIYDPADALASRNLSFTLNNSMLANLYQ